MRTAISSKWKEFHNPQIDVMKSQCLAKKLGSEVWPGLRRGLMEDFASLSKALTDYKRDYGVLLTSRTGRKISLGI